MQARRVPNHPLIDYLKCGWVVSSSNGLLCVDIGKNDISDRCLLLCSPAIGEVRQVPTTYTDFDGSLGFGFSPIINDYKIVRIYVDERFGALVEKVQLYSLSTGSWKQVELGILDGARIKPDSFTANGAIFWFGFKLGEKDEISYTVGEYLADVIFSFDIAMEVFTLIPIPTSLAWSHFNRLTIYDNKLAMLSYRWIRNSKSSLIDLWVMEEGAVGWTKKYTTNPYPRFLCTMTIWKNEIVCSISNRREMGNDKPNTVLFNLTTKEVTELAVSRSPYCHNIFNYVESLVPFGGMKLSATYV